ncbi:MAG: hypothetical protein K2P77_10310 [Burkholderiaceae bacterium]|nr:hypothetical protein [Burkholderiaceae bacterium]
MENQHKKIKGYRDLSQAEIDLMNQVKGKGEELRALIASVAQVTTQPLVASADNTSEHAELSIGQLVSLDQLGDTPEYWVRLADANFRTGLMFLTRAIAQPTSY